MEKEDTRQSDSGDEDLCLVQHVPLETALAAKGLYEGCNAPRRGCWGPQPYTEILFPIKMASPVGFRIVGPVPSEDVDTGRYGVCLYPESDVHNPGRKVFEVQYMSFELAPDRPDGSPRSAVHIHLVTPLRPMTVRMSRTRVIGDRDIADCLKGARR